MQLTALSLALFLLTFISSERLLASCCSSGAAFGVAKLLRHERAIVELSTITKLVTGSFDSKAHFKSGLNKSLPYLSVVPELSVVARVVDFFEPFLKLPVHINKSTSRVGAHVADITLGARSSLLRENFIEGFPALSLIASVRFPTGSSQLKDPSLPIEDETGTGSHLFSFGLIVEKAIADINFSAGYGMSFEPDYFRQVVLKSGLIHSPYFAARIIPHRGGLLSCTWSMAIHEQPLFEGRPLIENDRRKMTIAFSYSVGFHSHLKFNAELGSDLPLDYIGKNFTSEVFLRLGFRFGVF